MSLVLELENKGTLSPWPQQLPLNPLNTSTRKSSLFPSLSPPESVLSTGSGSSGVLEPPTFPSCPSMGSILLLHFLLNNISSSVVSNDLMHDSLDRKIPRTGTIPVCVSFMDLFIHFYFPPLYPSPCSEHMPCTKCQGETDMSGFPVLGPGPGTKSDKYFSVPTMCRAPCKGEQGRRCLHRALATWCHISAGSMSMTVEGWEGSVWTGG